MTTLSVEEGGTGTTHVKGYVSIPANNCAPINNDSGLVDFFGGFLVTMICLVVFYAMVLLVVKLFDLDNP